MEGSRSVVRVNIHIICDAPRTLRFAAFWCTRVFQPPFGRAKSSAFLYFNIFGTTNMKFGQQNEQRVEQSTDNHAAQLVAPLSFWDHVCMCEHVDEQSLRKEKRKELTIYTQRFHLASVLSQSNSLMKFMLDSRQILPRSVASPLSMKRSPITAECKERRDREDDLRVVTRSSAFERAFIVLSVFHTFAEGTRARYFLYQKWKRAV